MYVLIEHLYETRKHMHLEYLVDKKITVYRIATTEEEIRRALTERVELLRNDEDFLSERYVNDSVYELILEHKYDGEVFEYKYVWCILKDPSCLP